MERNDYHTLKSDRQAQLDAMQKHVSSKAMQRFRRKAYTVNDALKKWGVDTKKEMTPPKEGDSGDKADS